MIRPRKGPWRNPWAQRLAVLDRVGLRPGDSAIDLGCGPRGILDLLCERVSPGGRVMGLDADPVHVAMASEFVDGRGWKGWSWCALTRDAPV